MNARDCHLMGGEVTPEAVEAARADLERRSREGRAKWGPPVLLPEEVYEETPGPLTFTAEEVTKIIETERSRAAEIVMDEVAEGMVGLMVGQRMANKIVFAEE